MINVKRGYVAQREGVRRAEYDTQRTRGASGASGTTTVLGSGIVTR